ncbi:MAG TPA: LPS export ABC transporter permease LptG [Gammaproteobacteria bacterium]|nr:LPS export ABC transporter permease LptG [Gammaproteobacteria bacterium]
MGIIDRYIAGHVIKGSFAALLVLAGLSGFFAYMSELGDVRGLYTSSKAALYVLFTLPRQLYELFPTAVLIGSLISLGSLAAHSELIVLRVSGLSQFRISLSVLKGGLVLMVCAFIIGEFIAPPSEQYAQQVRAVTAHGNLTLQSDDALWVRYKNQVVHVENILVGDRLQKLEIYQFDDGMELKQITRASEAKFQSGKWHLSDVSLNRIGMSGIQSEQQKEMVWDELFDPDVLDVLTVEPEYLSFWSLYEYIEYVEENGQDSEQYRHAFWVKLITPFTTLVMLLVAMPFVFGSLRSSGTGKRMFIGIVLGLVFYLINKTFNRAGLAYDLYPLLSAALPTLLFAAGSIWALRRQP